jgi:hypothetical protein
MVKFVVKRNGVFFEVVAEYLDHAGNPQESVAALFKDGDVGLDGQAMANAMRDAFEKTYNRGMSDGRNDALNIAREVFKV